MTPPRRRVLLTHAPEMRERYFGAGPLAALRAAAEVGLNALPRPMTEDELVEAAADCDIAISDRMTPGTAAVFARLPGLVAFQRVAVDIRTVDVAAASRHGVLVTRASPGFVASVAEWIFGAMIDAARSTTGYTSTYRAGGAPEARMGGQLEGATIGVIGVGAIGARVCALAHAFGMRVLACDPYRPPAPPAIAVDLLTLLAESDFVVPLAVATEETENLIDAAALARMKPTAWLVNASRGNLVDETALEAALDSRRIAGAALDVGRAPDQMPSPRLAGRADVIASPHVGGLTPQAVAHQAEEAVRQCLAILRGEAPPGSVNADRASRLARLARPG